jgi:RNA polymerase sigma factor (sigma-70 family)
MLSDEDNRSAVLERAVDFGAIYEQHFPLLVGTAVERFQICETDAQTLAHEVFLAYFLKSSEVLDCHSWLVGAICNASREYLRKRALHVALSEEFAERPDPRLSRVGETLPDQLAARQAFSCVTPRCQLALRLRYLEGYSFPEIAEEIGATIRYAQKLVDRCLRQAHERYRERRRLRGYEQRG